MAEETEGKHARYRRKWEYNVGAKIVWTGREGEAEEVACSGEEAGHLVKERTLKTRLCSQEQWLKDCGDSYRYFCSWKQPG